MSWPGRRLLINFVTHLDTPGRAPLRPEGADQGFQPPTDIYETSDTIVVRVELAGMRPEQITISLDEGSGRLTISGRRDDPALDEPRRYFNVEIECGKFMRIVQLPRPVSLKGADASYDQGFLVVRLPIRSQASGEPRRVPIR